MGKASVASIAREHFSTLKDDSGRFNLIDIVFQIAMPILAGGLVLLSGWVVSDAGAMVTGVSIVAALMGAMAVLIFQIRLSIPEDKRLDVYDYMLVDEVFSNILWAILVGFALSLILVLYQSFNAKDVPIVGACVTSIVAASGLHFVIVVGMCLKRLNIAYMRIAAKRG
jgi:hypothetical protein